MLSINLKKVNLPSGWQRISKQLENGESVTILISEYPAEPLRISQKVTGRHKLIFGLYRAPGKFSEMEVKINNNKYWKHIQPVYFIDDFEGGIQDVILDPVDTDNWNGLPPRSASLVKFPVL